MYYDIQQFSLVDDKTLAVTFADGHKGMVRFTPQFFSGVFAPLKDKEIFASVCLEDGALTWPGHADIAPDSLYRDIVELGEAHLQ